VITKSDLSVSWGTEQWWRLSPLTKAVVVSDGVKHIAGKGLWWLITEIAAYEQIPTQAMKQLEANDAYFGSLRFWRLTVDTQKHTATLVCEKDTGEDPVVVMSYDFTDCPLEEVVIFSGKSDLEDPSIRRLLYMPSEY